MVRVGCFSSSWWWSWCLCWGWRRRKSGSSPKCESKKEMVGASLDGISVLEAPILLLVCFHKALKAELDEIYQFTSGFPLEVSSPPHSLVLQLRDRFQFLKLVYKYHCTAEDEVIFQALDLHVANVVCAYSLEHNGIHELFDSVFKCLNIYEDGNHPDKFQYLVNCIATLQALICQNILKEEEQIFPLLVQKFSFKEQAALVWQFFSSVPAILLEDLLPWMVSSFPKNEQANVVECIQNVVPKEKLLQEVVASWIGKDSQHSPIGFTSGENKATLSSEKSLYIKKFQKIHLSWPSSHKNCTQGEIQDNAKYHPFDCLHLWNGAIRNDLKQVLEELCEIRTSKVFSNVASMCGQLKFLADVLIFYSDAWENVFSPMISEFADFSLSFSCKRTLKGSHIEGLLCSLQEISFGSGTSMCELVNKLCQQLEVISKECNEHFAFQESEVSPFIHKHCDREIQQRLLYMSLQMMPLGLLKCVITWLSVHLNEGELEAVLCRIKLPGFALDVPFASLLHKWVCLGYSGKTSHEMFKRELQEMFCNKSYFFDKSMVERTRCSGNVRAGERFLLRQKKPNSLGKAKKGALKSSSQKITAESTVYSPEFKNQIFFPDYFKNSSPFSQYLADKSDAGSSLKQEFRPIDYIFLFHKALTNDLNYLVLESTKMVDNVTLLEGFRQRFHLVRSLYLVHSDNEDRMAFPALESKGQLQNISLSYTIDHKLEVEYFNQISAILDKICELHVSLPSKRSADIEASLGHRLLKYRRLCLKLHGKCKTMCITLGKHFQREEIELWPLFTEFFSNEEQNKIIGNILGNTRAEILQQMIPWLMASLSSDEQHGMLSLWRKATKNTMFSEWLAEWWEGMSMVNITSVAEESTVLPSWTIDPLEIVATYLSKESRGDPDGNKLHDEQPMFQTEDPIDAKVFSNSDREAKIKPMSGEMDCDKCSDLNRKNYEHKSHKVKAVTDQANKAGEPLSTNQKLRKLEEHIMTMSQEDLQAAIARVYRDTTLDPQKMAHITQTLHTSRWNVTQQKPLEEVMLSSNGGIPGQCPSYRSPLTFGCKHYKRNCKVFASCCEKLFTCRYCHDEIADHPMDKKSTTKMMCMNCLKVQPIGATCSNIACNGLSMAKYFCSICRLFDDSREIYHCPYCNLCRVGKGLGVDFFHCMNCNACMAKSLTVHICREKCFESNCPICHEDIFTSSSPVKALPCGHMMHSTCFQDYTCMHYTCPICSKSLGDMQVYFKMLDAYMAEAKIPEEYKGQTQDILCNDCEMRGSAPFHWLYHKCPSCDSYNTRLL